MAVARRIIVGVLVLGGVVVALVAGWDGLLVYGFFALIAAGLALAASIGGGWVEGASRGRFDDRDR